MLSDREQAMLDMRIPEPDDDWEEGEEEDEFESFDCHMDRHGDCGKAGSEECEFECPYRRTSGHFHLCARPVLPKGKEIAVSVEEEEEQEEGYPCPACGGTGLSLGGWDCEECDGEGYWDV